jgi:hypothetical protein
MSTTKTLCWCRMSRDQRRADTQALVDAMETAAASGSELNLVSATQQSSSDRTLHLIVSQKLSMIHCVTCLLFWGLCWRPRGQEGRAVLCLIWFCISVQSSAIYNRLLTFIGCVAMLS